MENKLPTAKKLLKKEYYHIILDSKDTWVKISDIEDAMIEFARMHVEAALKEASEKAKCCDDAIVDLDHTIIDAYVEKDSILNSYPLTNIK